MRGRALQGALLDTDADALNHGILLVLVGMVARLEASAEKLAEGLPEAGPERAQKGLDDAVTALVGLAVDEFDEHLALALGHLLHLRLVLIKQLFLKATAKVQRIFELTKDFLEKFQEKF